MVSLSLSLFLLITHPLSCDLSLLLLLLPPLPMKVCSCKGELLLPLLPMHTCKGEEEEIPPLSLLSTPTFSLSMRPPPALSLYFFSTFSTSSRTPLFRASFTCTRARWRNLFSPTSSLFSLSLSSIIFYINVSSSSAFLPLKERL